MSALETENRWVAGLVYDGVAQQIVAQSGIASVERLGVGQYQIELAEQLAGGWALADAMGTGAGGNNAPYLAALQVTATVWLVAVFRDNALTPVAVDAERVCVRFGALPVP